jgi:hypothetical protein
MPHETHTGRTCEGNPLGARREQVVDRFPRSARDTSIVALMLAQLPRFVLGLGNDLRLPAFQCAKSSSTSAFLSSVKRGTCPISTLAENCRALDLDTSLLGRCPAYCSLQDPPPIETEAGLLLVRAL